MADENVVDFGIVHGTREARAKRKMDRKAAMMKARGERTPEQVASMIDKSVETAKLYMERSEGYNAEQQGVVPGVDAGGRKDVEASAEQAAPADDPNTSEGEGEETEHQNDDGSTEDQTPLTIEERLDLMEQENASLRERSILERREMELDRDNWRDRFNREAGRRDFNRKSDRAQNDGTADDISDLLTELDDETGEEESRSKRAKYDPDKIARAKAKAFKQYLADHKDLMVKGEGDNEDLNPFVAGYIQDNSEEFLDDTRDINPSSAYKKTMRLMEQANVAYQLEQRRLKDEDVQSKRSAIRSKNRTRKLKTQLSDSSAGKPIQAGETEDPSLEGLSRKDRLREKLRRQPQRQKSYN